MESKLTTAQTYIDAFRQAAIGIAFANLDGRMIGANSAYAQMLGYSDEEILEQSFIELTHPDDRAPNMVLVRELVAGSRSSFDIHKRYRRRDGSWIWVLNSVSMVQDEDGEPSGLVAFVQDVDARTRAAQERERLAQLVGEAEVRRKHALQLNDDVLQGLAVAKMSLELQDHDRALEALSHTIETAKRLIHQTLDEAAAGAGLEPGDLVRSTASEPSRPDTES